MMSACVACGKRFDPANPVGWRVFVLRQVERFTCPQCANATHTN